ncbi:MAG: hypothetical protein COC22_00555 [Flavobacteriaceae bacterium]|nr:MAG: hypothetical protein COC22_00555 [Flavobacteriaceae bacterium]
MAGVSFANAADTDKTALEQSKIQQQAEEQNRMDQYTLREREEMDRLHMLDVYQQNALREESILRQQKY